MEIFSNNQSDWMSYNDVELLERTEVSAISNYLDDVIDQTECINYEIEQALDPLNLSEFLNEDLPKSVHKIGRKSLIDDIVALSLHFYDLSESKNIKIGIEPVSDNMCRLFHVDNIKQRMICTYKGAGTEWLEDSNVKRAGLGSGDNVNVVRDFNLVNRVKSFDILLLKGRKYNNTSKGAVHRSPQVSKSCQTRFLLKLDEF